MSQPSSPSLSLPIISLQQPLTPSSASTLLSALTTHGFTYIHPSTTPFCHSPNLIPDQFALSRRLFALSNAVKTRYLIDKTSNDSFKGWTGMGGEVLDPKAREKGARGDVKEAWNLGEGARGEMMRFLPDEVKSSGERETEALMREFERCCVETCGRVCDLLDLALKVDESTTNVENGVDEKSKTSAAATTTDAGDKSRLGWFKSRHTVPSGSITRLLHYPAVSDGEIDAATDVRAGAHSDYGSMTLLFQVNGQPGLEIRRDSEDGSSEWVSVDVLPEGYHDPMRVRLGEDEEEEIVIPPILLNIGDLLSYWTNGLLKSTVHRVVFPKGEKMDRYSIAYFCHPGDDERLVAVPSQMVTEMKEKFERDGGGVGYGGGADGGGGDAVAMTAKEHLMRRLRATYG